MKRFIVEHLTSKGWEIIYDDDDEEEALRVVSNARGVSDVREPDVRITFTRNYPKMGGRYG